MDLIPANWQAPSTIKALTTSRLGGVSLAPYNSFNLGDHVGDDSAAVIQNRQLLTNHLSLPSQPSWLQQVHGTEVINLVKPLDHGHVVEADGVFTSKPDVVCGILTADCLPIFIANQQGTKVALLHAGWRGLANGIIEKGIASFKQSGTELIAYAGPCISKAAFEIGAEVKEQLGGDDACYHQSTRAGHFYADLVELSRLRCEAVGLTQFTASQYCTYNDAEMLYSYRRDGETGRMASLLWIETKD